MSNNFMYGGRSWNESEEKYFDTILASSCFHFILLSLFRFVNGFSSRQNTHSVNICKYTGHLFYLSMLVNELNGSDVRETVFVCVDGNRNTMNDQ